jgi:TetR/AcrR family tetracycline transcriptional repressor
VTSNKKRGPSAGAARPQITSERIVEAGLETLAADGFDALSMRRLAERLGIKAASLYNHVSDKNQLLALMADAICAQIPDLDSSEAWRRQLEALARALRGVLMAHRDGARVLAATPPIGSHRMRLIEQVLRATQIAGFSPSKTVDVASTLNSYVVGFVLDEAQGSAGDASSRKRVHRETKRWIQSLPRETYPTLRSLSSELIDAPAERRFEFGLTALLDGFELQLRKRS